MNSTTFINSTFFVLLATIYWRSNFWTWGMFWWLRTVGVWWRRSHYINQQVVPRRRRRPPFWGSCDSCVLAIIDKVTSSLTVLCSRNVSNHGFLEYIVKMSSTNRCPLKIWRDEHTRKILLKIYFSYFSFFYLSVTAKHFCSMWDGTIGIVHLLKVSLCFTGNLFRSKIFLPFPLNQSFFFGYLLRQVLWLTKKINLFAVVLDL